MTDVSVVLACYDEGPGLAGKVARLRAVLAEVAPRHELILVDDASRDGTARVIRGLEGGGGVVAVYHDANRGRGAAVRDGFLRSRGKVVGFLDPDLEIPAEHLPRFLDALRAGADGAVAWRSFPFRWRYAHRIAASLVYRWLCGKVLGTRGSDVGAGFKFFRRECALELMRLAKDDGWFWDTEIVYWARRRGYRLAPVDCDYRRDPAKGSTVRFARDTFGHLVSLLRFKRAVARARS